MCTPAIGWGIAGLVGGLVASKALAPKVPDAPAELPAATTPAAPQLAAPPLPATQTPPQPAKAPDIQQLRAAVTGAKTGRNANISSTMLTGPAGVDLSSASIGKNTLLGQ